MAKKVGKKYQDAAKLVDASKLYAPKEAVELVKKTSVTKLIALAKKNGSDSIVIGSRGLSGIAEFFLGSVSSKVSQYATIPVLINYIQVQMLIFQNIC